MVSKEECEREGKMFVQSHDDGKGGWTRAYCREKIEAKSHAKSHNLKNQNEIKIKFHGKYFVGSHENLLDLLQYSLEGSEIFPMPEKERVAPMEYFDFNGNYTSKSNWLLHGGSFETEGLRDGRACTIKGTVKHVDGSIWAIDYQAGEWESKW